MLRLTRIGIVSLLLTGCGSSDAASPASTSSAVDGGAQREGDGVGDASASAVQDGDAGVDGGGSTPAETSSDFATTLYTTVVVEGVKDVADPVAATTWTAIVNLYDVKTTQPVGDAMVKVGRPGDLHVIPWLGSSYSLHDFATGDIPELEVSIERGTATLHDPHLTSPGIHSSTWTNAADGADSVKHTVTWTPSGNAAVLVNLIGAASPVLGIADTGRHEWTEPGSPTTGTTPVQVVRIETKTLAARSVGQVIVRVRSKI